MPVLPYPEPETLSPEARAVIERAPQNIARMYAGTGEIFVPFMNFAAAMFNKGALGHALRELLTVRIAHRLGANYVLDQHALMARGAGVSDEKLEATKGTLPSPVFSEEESVALEFIDAAIDNIKLPAAIVRKADAVLGRARTFELFIVAGFYHMSAQFTETLELEPDAGAKGNALENMKTFD